MQFVSEALEPTDASSLSESANDDSTMSLARFIEKRFIPDHVERKSLSGRTHYHAILKHVLRPETVDRLFTPYVGIGRARLKALPEWPYLDHVRLCDISSEHVQQLVTTASTHGYSHQTLKHIRNVVSAIISHAKREHMFDGDSPIADVELPPTSDKAAHNLTIVQAKTMLKLMRYPEREIALITITTGMSISEICALQWKHVNLSGSTVYVEGKLIPARSIGVRKQWNASGLVEANSNRVRSVLVPDPLIRALTRLRQGQKIASVNCFVIATQEGVPIRPASVRMMRLKPIGRELQMPWLSWQVLKRAHDALLLELRIQLSHELVLSIRKP
jgi:integrase